SIFPGSITTALLPSSGALNVAPVIWQKEMWPQGCVGCSARMAVLQAKGQLAPGDSYVGHSIIGGRFDCRLTQTTEVGPKPAIRPSIAGRAWVTGSHRIWADPSDPWPRGYKVGDTWMT
ncbi:MAG: proline racemase family protein, partial [Pseudomonadota bacterium]